MARLQVGRKLRLEATYTKSVFARPDGRIQDDVDLAGAKALHHFDARWSLRAQSQLDTYRRTVRSDVLLSFLYRPGTRVYLGYQNVAGAGAPAPAGHHRLFLKLSYAVSP